MKLTILCCVFMAFVIGGRSTSALNVPYLVPSAPGRIEPVTTSTPASTTRKPCGSHNLGDYKGGCDESVPVVVMPKGRPIMERVLDWFNCNTEECQSKRK